VGLIAQMRAQSQSKERQQANQGTIENMSIDDFIVPNSVASPANISRSPSAEITHTEDPVVASAIPIKKQNELRGQTYTFGTSAPGPQAPIQQRAGEFGYVQRHVRKTSIDERRVCVVYSKATELYQTDFFLASQTTSRELSSSIPSSQSHTSQ